MPVIALMNTMAKAVTNVSFRACRAYGSVSAFQKSAPPGWAAWTPRAASGSTTMRPRYDRVRPRSSSGAGATADGPRGEITSLAPHARGEDRGPDPFGPEDLVLDLVPTAQVRDGEQPRRPRPAQLRGQIRVDRPEPIVGQDALAVG